ncbi:MAG TPA: FxLYD domain-containing protein [Ktedonobacteraceae bacterium]|nr:FxLYD domain-containing protein [Ktedonobacteraceae bacterium]
MGLSRHMGKLPLLVVASLMAMTLALVACGGGTATTASAPRAVATTPPTSTPVPATATVSALVKMIFQVGQPTAKMLSGATFEVDGQIKNGDNKQHDITLQVTLLDASGKVVATATKLVDNVPGGATVAYSIQGTTTQPAWQGVQVTVIKVSENVNGTGQD